MKRALFLCLFALLLPAQSYRESIEHTLVDPVSCGNTWQKERADCIRDLTSDLATTRAQLVELRALERRTEKLLKEVSK